MGNIGSFPAGGEVRPDLILLTDALPASAVEEITARAPADPQRVVVTIDHDTPNSSIEVGAWQRQLIQWAVEKGANLEKCRGVGYLRLLETYIHPGMVIAGTGEHMAGLAAGEALGLVVTEEELPRLLAGGTVNLGVPHLFPVSLTGHLTAGATIQDAALDLLRRVKPLVSPDTLIVLSPEEMQGLSREDRYDLCHLLGAAGGRGVVIMEIHRPPSFSYDISKALPCAAPPGRLDSAAPLTELPLTKVDEVFIGGCRGGKLTDLRRAAAILRGRHTAYRLRLIVAPATSSIYVQALREGLLTTFLEAGAVVMNQGCSVCWGRAQGILDSGEVLVSTGSYTFPGCAGAKDARVYLVSPETAAHCAITGYLGKYGSKGEE